jgi:hypothetical protein
MEENEDHERLEPGATPEPEPNHFSRVHQLNSAIAVATPTTSSQFGFDPVGLAHEDNCYVEVARRSKSAVNFDVRRLVASHCVENDLAR